MGRLFVKYKQPEIVGEMLAGIILGPTLFNLISSSEALSAISELAVFLVVLSAGLEMNFKDVIQALKGKGLVIAIIAFILPLCFGTTVGLIFDYDTTRSVFIGLCCSITALPIAVKMLENFGLLKSDVAKYAVATAIINDVVSLLAIGVLLDLPAERSFSAIAFSVGLTGGKLFLLAMFILAINYGLEYAQDRGLRLREAPEKMVKIFGNDALFGIVLLFVLVFGSVSETLGFHFVIGAFFGALLIDHEFFYKNTYVELERTLGSITNGFLGPVFFAYLGLEFNVIEITSFSFILVLLLVVFLTKTFAGIIGGRLIGLDQETSTKVGLILNARGVMDLVIASVAFNTKFIDQGLYSALIILGIVTTMLTPFVYKGIFKAES
jgi:Kef-type K+ transport system membrane component KefB